MEICSSCLTPKSRPRVIFINGVCNACINSETKKTINWKKREEEFLIKIDEMQKYAKANNNCYHCIVPWSGGKDSSSIALKLKKNFDLNPLLVTFSPLIQNECGQHNRKILLDEGFDSIMFSPNGNISRNLSKRFFIERGNPKVAWDAGVNSIPIKFALKHNIPYVIYAEHGESEYGGLTIDENSKKERNLREVIEHQIGDFPENWQSSDIGIDDLYPYIYPSEEELNKKNIKAFYFSYFFKWSMYENYEYIKANLKKFKTNPYGRTEGTFTNFDSLDDKIDDLYYYMQFIKFGFGRCVRDSSRLIQSGHLSRKDAKMHVKQFDGEIPKRFNNDVLDFLEMNDTSLNKIIDKHRNNEIWQAENNSWKLRFNII